MAARSITKLLTSPSKVANALDWKKASGSLLSLTICKDKIDLAVSSHPSFEEALITLPSIPLKTKTVDNMKVLDKCVVSELTTIVQDNNVCGMVVSWPVQKRGWCGAPCGRVLHTLDQLTAQSNTLLSKNRPICLWDEEHHLPPEDEWGRAEIYSHTPKNKEEHCASTEQYGDHKTVAVDVWNDFCRSHWPELYYQQREETSASSLDDFDLFQAGKQTLSVESSAAAFPWLDAAEEGGQSLNQALL